MERDDFVCSGMQNFWPYIMLITALILLTIILLCFVYYYRFEITVIIFEKLNWHPFDKQDEGLGKIYDAYLMYCDSDHKYAQNTILKGLEKKGYRKADHQRERELGALTEEETAKFLEQSHRVIVVVSQNVLSDTKVMHDFYRAESQGKARGKKRFIIMVVMHDKLNFGNHPVFLYYINTNYFIKATSNRFWPRLFYWLPQQQCDDDLPAPIVDCSRMTEDHPLTEYNSISVDHQQDSGEPSESSPLLPQNI